MTCTIFKSYKINILELFIEETLVAKPIPKKHQ